MARSKAYYVAHSHGLNLRETPSKNGDIVCSLQAGTKVMPDFQADAPKGWVAVKLTGYVMQEFLSDQK